MKLDVDYQTEKMDAPIDRLFDLPEPEKTPLFVKSPERLLVLEDDPYCAKILQHKISMAWPDCATVLVTNKREFISALENNSFDLILSDYLVPDFHGTAALAWTRELLPDMPFIFVSGAIGDEVGVECLKLGATDYVLKDRLARLVPAIERALDEARKNRERKLVTTNLEQSHRQYEALVNSVDGIVWQADQASLRFTFVSRQAIQLLGYPAEFWLEKPEFWQRHIYPEDRETVVNNYRKLTTFQGHCQFEYRMLASDGRLVWLRDNVSLSVENDGLHRIQGIMVDITEQKLAQAEIQHIQNKLQESNNDLLQKNQEIQNFYHTLSHELKTPLTSAREFISLVMDGVAGPLNPTQQEYLGIAKESCDQLRVCTNDLLDATRLETGKMSLELKPASLASLINRVVTSLKSHAVERNITLVSEVSDGLAEILMDEHRINQTITNLLNNAINHTPSGGKIVAKAGEVFGRSDFVQVSICDTGCGISKQEQERIFNRLYQIKTGDATSKNGIGLGLYLCKELVQLHGGDIWVESEPGQGSNFTFILPKNQLSLRPKVLVIDDDTDIIEMTRNTLEEEYNVRCVQDGAEGLNELRRQLPDVVLLDLSMPNMDGVATLKQIRKNWDAIPVIVHTAYSNGEIMKQAMEFSPFTLLSKPSSVGQLRETVRNVLRSMETTIWNRNRSTLKAIMAK
jgi:PAS domain S-box-containing protein